MSAAGSPPNLTLTIDGREVRAAAGLTIWEAARAAGIDIPVLCHSPRMRPVGVCRVCVVDVGGRTLPAACVRAAEPGMRVETRSDRVERSRRVLVELLMSDHEAPCARERTTGDCELEALARSYGVMAEADLTPAFGHPFPEREGAKDHPRAGVRSPFPSREGGGMREAQGAGPREEVRSAAPALPLPRANGRPRDDSSPV